MPTIFEHEKLNVYQHSLDFVEFAETLLSNLPKGLAAHDQIDCTSTSIPLNLAEGNGNFAAKDRCRFFDIARGSALECAAALDVLTRRNKIGATTAEEGKIILKEVVSMIVGWIRSQEGGRVYEDPAAYNEGG